MRFVQNKDKKFSCFFFVAFRVPYIIYCESFAFWSFTASLRRRSAFRIVSNFYAVSENVNGVKFVDFAKCGAGAEAKVKIPKGETFTGVCIRDIL